MFALIVHFHVRVGHEPAFDALVARTVDGIRAHETGTLLYAVHSVDSDPGTRVFYMLFENRAAYDAHEKRDYTARFIAERARYLAAPPRVQFLSTRCVVTGTDRGGVSRSPGPPPADPPPAGSPASQRPGAPEARS